MPVNTGKLEKESGYHSPGPLVHILGCANETRVVIEGVQMTTLMDTGSQISVLTKGFCTERGLKILPLSNLMKGVLHLEGMGAF